MRLLYKACGTSRVSEPQIIWNKNDRKKILMRGKQWDSYSVIVLNMCLFCLPDRVALWRRVTDALPCRNTYCCSWSSSKSVQMDQNTRETSQ